MSSTTSFGSSSGSQIDDSLYAARKGASRSLSIIPIGLFELKHDGFRALAIVDGHHCQLVSRRRHVYTQFPQLAEEVAHKRLG